MPHNKTTQDRPTSSLINRLKASTLLSTNVPMQYIPELVIDLLRSMAGFGDENPQDNSSDDLSDHTWAKRTLNKIWAGREAYEQSDHQNNSPVSNLTTLRGALTAYWTSEKWAQAWMATGATVGLIALSAQNAVWVTEATAQFISTLTHLDNPEIETPFHSLVDSLKNLSPYLVIQIASWVAARQGEFYLERNMSLHIRDQFLRASLAEPDIIHRVTHNKKEGSDAPDAMPDSPHKRIGGAVDEFASNLVNVSAEFLRTILTSVFVGKAIMEKSVSSAWLDELGTTLNTAFPNGIIDFVPGEYGAAVASTLLLTSYIGLITPASMSLGKAFERNFQAMAKTEGILSKSLVDLFNRGESIAASQGHHVVRKALSQQQKDHYQERENLHKFFIKFNSFQQINNILAETILSLIPALSTSFDTQGKLSPHFSTQTFLETQGLTASLLHSVSATIRAVPMLSQIRASGTRITEMAQMFEAVQGKKSFYAQSGVHDFTYKELDGPENDRVLKISNLALMHREQADPFVTIANMEIKQGDWIHLKGASGQGKSSFIKALRYLFPYGQGEIRTQKGLRPFYAHQTPDISGSYTLAQHLRYGMNTTPDDGCDKDGDTSQRMQDILQKTGLSEYIHCLEEKGLGGQSWDEVLSGGQQQRLVLARILFQRPDLILLDEPTSALDPQAKEMFFATLKENNPEATILAITHDETVPDGQNGKPYFNKTLIVLF